MENSVQSDARCADTWNGCPQKDRGTFLPEPWRIRTFKAADEVHLPVSKGPDGTVSHPRCVGLCQTPQRTRFLRGLSSACLEVSHLPRQDVPLLQTPQLIVLRTKAFDGFIVPKFTTGANNFRAGRECRAGEGTGSEWPRGSRQEIATYKSAGTRLGL